jgi:tetratricopeptide (TPR) repeat protein
MDNKEKYKPCPCGSGKKLKFCCYEIRRKFTIEQYLENKGKFEKAFRCLQDGNFEEAIQGFNQVLSSEPDHVQSYGNLGLAYAGLGDRKNALLNFDKAIDLDSTYLPAINNRKALLSRPHGEILDLSNIHAVNYYADKEMAEEVVGLTRSNKTLEGSWLRKMLKKA